MSKQRAIDNLFQKMVASVRTTKQEPLRHPRICKNREELRTEMARCIRDLHIQGIKATFIREGSEVVCVQTGGRWTVIKPLLVQNPEWDD